MLTLSVLVASNHPTKSIVRELEQPAKFVIASWTGYPDEYGQGIYGFRFYENSTGSWVLAPYYNDIGKFYFLNYYDPYTLNWSEGVAMKLRVYSILNTTLTGAIDEADGQNYQRHTVNVTSLGTTVFSQQNFTYVNVTPYEDIPAYEYDVILEFLPLAGEIYMVTVDYEVFYTEAVDSEYAFASSGSTDAQTPTGDYTDTHSVNSVFFGGTSPCDLSVILWVELSEGFGSFKYSAYWNSSISSNIYIYNYDISDWTLLDASPNGEGVPLAWDNDTVNNENYHNETTIGFMFQCGVGEGGEINIDYFQIQVLNTTRWHNINTAILMFIVGYPIELVFLGNIALIILGLIMIPVSTIYLAYGVKHDRSSNRLFYGLIIFMVGCGLFIGGILP